MINELSNSEIYTKRMGYTLAEILITLGIIGIVTAIITPTLVTKYQKKVSLTRLKQAYSIIQNAILASQAENGDPQSWGLNDYINNYDPDNIEQLRKDTLTQICEKYIIPYIKTSSTPELNTLKNAGWSEYKLLSGQASERPSLTTKNYIIPIINGTTIIAAINGTSTQIVSIIFYIDINGPQGPNISGKDGFATELKFSNGSFGFYGMEQNDSNLAKLCTNKGTSINGSIGCGAIIYKNGWEYPKNYPWK